MNRKRKYQDGGSKETPDSTGQGGAPPQVQNPLIQSNRADQKRVNDQIMMRTISSQNQALHITNAMSEIEAERKLVQQQQFQQQMMVMQTRMQMLQQQNDLLKTKIEKDDLINSARTIPSNNQKAMNSPKKRGGSTKYSKGGGKKKSRAVFSQSMGSMMKKGGQCGLPGGRYSKKR
tara:strand:- start:10704 stop:11231 length:528 start_codon:yes stop_codon:yes gene_type:complete